jgi:hypothetical protein
MNGKIISLENGPERNVKLVINANEFYSEISSPAGSLDPQSIDHYEIIGMQERDTGLATLTVVLVDGQRVCFYRTESKFDMALLLDQLRAIGPRRREFFL